MIELNKPICGDCLKVMPLIPDHSVDMILCDPPYCLTGELTWDTIIPFEEMWKEYHRIIKPNGAILLFGQEPFTSKLIMSNLKEFKYRWTWEKSKASNYLHAKQQPLRASEDIAVFYAKQPTYNPQFSYGDAYNKGAGTRLAPAYGARGRETEIKSEDGKRYPRTVIYFKTAETQRPDHKTFHPTEKPIDLLEYMIKTYTNEGETVLDNCAGSFSTAIAAEKCGRNWIGIEQNPDYCEIGKQRLEELRKADLSERTEECT